MKSNRELLDMAIEVSQRAYAPYSKFPVGACVLFESGNYYVGCNIENSSYGLALCAERSAISSAVANGENSKIIKIAIYSPKSVKCFPCGACRQWIQEFAKGYNAEIILEDENDELCVYYIDDILPFSFHLI